MRQELAFRFLASLSLYLVHSRPRKFGSTINKIGEASCAPLVFSAVMNARSEDAEQTFQSLPLLVAAPQPSRPLARLFACARGAFRLEIPFGYEDQAGFHYGCAPAPAKVDSD